MYSFMNTYNYLVLLLLSFPHSAAVCVEEGSNGCESFVIQAACRVLEISGTTVPTFC